MQQLKDYLKKNNLTQKDFAKQLGIHHYTLNTYIKLRRKTPPPIQKLIQFLTKNEVRFDE